MTTKARFIGLDNLGRRVALFSNRDAADYWRRGTPGGRIVAAGEYLKGFKPWERPIIRDELAQAVRVGAVRA